MAEYKLTQEIIQLSYSNIWDTAKLEWSLDYIYEAEEPERCLCGHFPIIEICILKNKVNGNAATVGNSCVKKFMGLTSSDKIFKAVKKVRKNIGKSLNAEALDYAHQKSWINDWELEFANDTRLKRLPTAKQLETRKKINQKILLYMKIIDKNRIDVSPKNQ